MSLTARIRHVMEYYDSAFAVVMLTPRVVSLEPAEALVGGDVVDVTVVGDRFRPDAKVLWGGVATSSTRLDARRLVFTAPVPAYDVETVVEVGVRQRLGEVVLDSNTVGFDIRASRRR